MKTDKACRGVAMKVLGLLLILLCWEHGSAVADEVFVLKGGSTKFVVEGGVKKIVVGSPGVIEAQPTPDGQGVMIRGLSEGTSELRVEPVQGVDVVHRVVVRADLKERLEIFKELLSDVDGLEMKVVDGRIVLRGMLVTMSEYDRVKRVVGTYPELLDLTKFDRKDMNAFTENEIRHRIAMDTVTVKISGDTAVLEGVVYNEAEMNRAVELAKTYMPNVRSLLRLQEVMIETDVQFVQVTADNASDFGHNVLSTLQVGGAAGASGAGQGRPSINWSANASASLRINALIGSGQAKMLAQPHLSTKSGGEGTFHSGGEVYFAVAGDGAGSLQKVEWGVILRVKPLLLGRDRILNEVTVQVSVPAAQTQGAISLEKFESKGTVMCNVGESIVLSGLIQELVSRFGRKTPLLGDVPLLNLFFSQKGSKNEKKELVVLITPVPVLPEPAAGGPLSQKTSRLWNEQGAEAALNHR